MNMRLCRILRSFFQGNDLFGLQGQYISPRQLEAESTAAKRHAAPVQFNNAPWQHNEQDFPQMAASATPQQPAMSSGKSIGSFRI